MSVWYIEINEIEYFMPRQTVTKVEFDQLKQEVKTLRALLLSMVPEDDEGEYKPAFVKKVKKILKSKGGALHVFKDKESFLAELRKV